MKLKAGDYVAKGSYGCTFSPPFGLRAENDKIGKLMSYETAREEYSYSERFRTLDPSEKYGVYGSRPVQVNTRSMVEDAGGEDQILKCTIKIHRPFQVIMQKATGDLEKLPKNSSLFFNIFREMGTMHNLMEGLKKYHDGDMVHLDIKPANTVFFGNRKTGVSESYKFIDFGLGSKIEEAVKEKDSILGSSYIFWPVLTTLVFSGVFEKRGFDVDIIRKLNTDRHLQSKYLPTVLKDSDPVISVKRDFQNLCKTYDIVIPGTAEEVARSLKDIKRALLKATDISSLSLVMYYLAVNVLGLKYDERLKIKLIDSEGVHDKIDLERIGNMIYDMNHFRTHLTLTPDKWTIEAIFPSTPREVLYRVQIIITEEKVRTFVPINVITSPYDGGKNHMVLWSVNTIEEELTKLGYRDFKEKDFDRISKELKEDKIFTLYKLRISKYEFNVNFIQV